MRNTVRYLSTLAALLAAGALVQTPLAAQAAITLNAPPANTNVAMAQALETRALAEKYGNRDWAAAAADLKHAASLRGWKDPVAIEDNLVAAEAFDFLGETGVARIAADEAGRQAERLGLPDVAVRAYVGAFRYAMALDNVDLANSYLERLSRLAASPRVSAETRKEFLAPVAMYLTPGRD